MRSRYLLQAAVIAAFFIAASAVLAQQPNLSLKGCISGEKSAANFEMSLKRDGNAISGSYYYVRSGSANKLMLKGSVAVDGSFTMQEFDAAGKQTGEFKGKWHDGPDD